MWRLQKQYYEGNKLNIGFQYVAFAYKTFVLNKSWKLSENRGFTQRLSRIGLCELCKMP